MKTAAELCRPQCPQCGCHFLSPKMPIFGLFYSFCRCGWRGLVRYWREQETT